MTNKELTTQVAHAKALIESRKKQLLEVLPKHIEPERMKRVFQNAVSRNRKLLQCNDLSILTTLSTCGAFGLEPNTPLGQCYIIPYKDEATFQMGYQGLIELARRAGTTITCGTVHENDTVIAREGLHSDFDIQYDVKQGRGEVIGVYAIAETREGQKLWKYMSKIECEAHGKKYSKAWMQKDRYGNYTSAWQTNPVSMWLKTVIIQVCKYAPKAILAEWVMTERREGIKLDSLNSVSALTDDDSVTFDVDAEEIEPEKPTLDDVAAEADAATKPIPPQQPEESPVSNSGALSILTDARKKAGYTVKEVEAFSNEQFNCPIAELDAAQKITLAEVVEERARQRDNAK